MHNKGTDNKRYIVFVNDKRLLVI